MARTLLVSVFYYFYRFIFMTKRKNGCRCMMCSLPFISVRQKNTGSNIAHLNSYINKNIPIEWAEIGILRCVKRFAKPTISFTYITIVC